MSFGVLQEDVYTLQVGGWIDLNKYISFDINILASFEDINLFGAVRVWTDFDVGSFVSACPLRTLEYPSSVITFKKLQSSAFGIIISVLEETLRSN